MQCVVWNAQKESVFLPHLQFMALIKEVKKLNLEELLGAKHRLVALLVIVDDAYWFSSRDYQEAWSYWLSMAKKKELYRLTGGKFPPWKN